LRQNLKDDTDSRLNHFFPRANNTFIIVFGNGRSSKPYAGHGVKRLIKLVKRVKMKNKGRQYLMHFVLSWSIRNDYTDPLENEMKDQIKDFSWVRPFNSFYIINVGSQSEWRKIITNLQKVCSKYPKEAVNFIASPLMEGARYDGYLDTELWEMINERSV
jgi:hypothetical protein